MKNLIVTGSSGLVGSEVVSYFSQQGWIVHGIDNNMRADFFGPSGDTTENRLRLEKNFPAFCHHEKDVRDRSDILSFFKEIKPDAVVHAAAQPSHDLAAFRPFDDFGINAGGTINLLEANRNTNPDIPFIYISTNKVYGDGPNRLNLVEKEKRWDYQDQEFYSGINEDFPIDQSKHSLFGASKLAGDILVQEYGRYFDMPSCCLRGGCITGAYQSGVELHGFLNYLIQRHASGKPYRIFGYKGKQVRDNIHSNDLVRFIDLFLKKPRIGEVYNIGGGRENSISILEAFDLIESISSKKTAYEYIEKNRKGDHICYITNLQKIKTHYPQWSIKRELTDIFEEIYSAFKDKYKKS